MSSRAASGRKRLKPAAGAPPSVPSIPQPTANGFNRPQTNPNVNYTSPQVSPNSLYHIPPSSDPSSFPATPTSSSFRSSNLHPSQPARDRIPAEAFQAAPYPHSSQAQEVYQPPLLKGGTPAPFRTTNHPPEPPFSPNAPSYTTFAANFSDSEFGSDSRHSSRALPPYPGTPPANGGWAAHSDVKVAAAMVVPPSSPEDLRRWQPYPPPPFGAEPRSPGPFASTSRLPSTHELPETPRAEAHPPYYSPPSSPRLLPSRLRVTNPFGPSPPPQSNRTSPQYSPSPYPTPQSSSFPSPSTSLASLPPTIQRLETHHEDNHSGSSDSHSARSVASRAHSAIQSSRSSSSSTRSAPEHAPAPQPTFVFPSSRSSARPKGNTAGGGFKFRGRRKVKTPLPIVQVLAPGTPIPAEGVFTAQAPPHPQPHAHAPDARRRARPPESLRLAPTMSEGSGSGSSGSGSISPAAATPTFYFPSSRTRAHPKSPTKFILNQDKDKGKKSAHEGGISLGKLRMGMGFKKAAGAAEGNAAGRGTSPMESAFAMQQQAPQDDSERYGAPTSPLPEPAVNGRQPSPMEHAFATRQQASRDERYGTRTPPERRNSYDLNPPDRTGVPAPPQVVQKIGTYPLDAYDAGLMESDRETLELLRKLNSTNTPSFHNYGGRPPRNVLDLGCGAGHWMLDAATAWRNSGVQIVGFDMVDTTKGLWPLAQHTGVAENLRFVRGNFVKQELPFADGSFQLVRMASLALCIPYERWEFVLQQVWRVLAVGGRLELIDDHVFFPYGKPHLSSNTTPPSQSQSPANAPHLDTMIPSTVFSRMSIADVVDPALRDDTDSGIYNLYDVEEEDDTVSEQSDTGTISSGRRREAASLSGAPPSAEAWNEQAASARELEALFEHMMNFKFGIHLRPSDFVNEMLRRVFGRAREVTAMHITLAPPDHASTEGHGVPGRERGRDQQTAALDALGQCPGFIVWPSMFLPMPISELETHAAKHLRMLLSCKAALVDYAAEMADRGEGEAQGEAAMEALWEYQNFLRQRFDPPTDNPSGARADTPSSAGDADSIRGSIYSVSSVGSEARDAMREYQTELHSRFEWTPDAGRDAAPTPTPLENPSAAASTSAAPRVRKSRSRGSRGRDRTSAVASSVAPPYSRIELTHVRTFFVYEAVKLADGKAGSLI